MPLMRMDLETLIELGAQLSVDQIQYITYQILRGLQVSTFIYCTSLSIFSYYSSPLTKNYAISIVGFKYLHGAGLIAYVRFHLIML